jgi:hypothetical protein
MPWTTWPRSAPTSTISPHSDVPAYGISTGFGALANRHIPNDLRTQLQKSLIRSHAAGMGPAVEREVVRGIMFLRAKTLASGRTGVRPVVLQTMVDVLNAGITPVVREFGSLGCSGDLAPLSHCALVLMGEGEATGPDGELYGAAGKPPVAELLAAARDRAGHPRREGGPGPRQRHRRHARHAPDGHRGHPFVACDGGCHRRAQR